MSFAARLWRSSLGKKYLMAGSGLVLLLFVIGHMLGNLQIFLPPEALNRYGHLLQSNLALLWPVRLILLALLVLHLVTALQLRAMNREARPEAYASPVSAYGASLASRTMLVSGLIVGAFIVYHLLHYTVKLQTVSGTSIPFKDLKEAGTGYHDVYAMMVAGFRVWYVSLFYAVGVGLLCFHLGHGINAAVQSLGLRTPACAGTISKISKTIAWLLLIGYLSIPTAVMLGLGRDYLDRVTLRLAGSPVAGATQQAR